MASAPAGDSALPPLIRERVEAAGRLVVLATASHHALRVARSLSAEFGMDLVVAGGVDGTPHEPPAAGDFLVHGVPDVFGRVVDDPAGWQALVVVERICGPVSAASPWRIEVGDESAHSPSSLSTALAALDRHLRQQRRVRPLFSPPPAMGLPYIAPEGITLPGAFGRVDAPTVPGLPDLVVVRPHGDPSTVR
jgi:hypothetical protein